MDKILIHSDGIHYFEDGRLARRPIKNGKGAVSIETFALESSDDVKILCLHLAKIISELQERFKEQ